MSRAVSVHDVSQESFAGLLNRLTQDRLDQDRLNQDLLNQDRLDQDRLDQDRLDQDRVTQSADSVGGRGEDAVSISRRGVAAAMAEAKRRPMAAVRRGGRSVNQATEPREITYEQALRQINRHKIAAVPEAGPPQKSLHELDANPGARPLPKTSERSASKRQAPSSRYGAGKRVAAEPAATTVTSGPSAVSRRTKETANRRGSTSKSAVPRAGAELKAKLPTRPLVDTDKSSAASDRIPSGHAGTKRMTGATVSGKAQRPPTLPSSARSIERTHKQSAAASEERELGTMPNGISPALSAALELACGGSALEHRHAVVSIRVNDMEFDQLRRRAAESGLSVSAYMRSCVLEAEHLRSQVKQALAEMRSSIHMHHSTPPDTSISVLARKSHTNPGAIWTRFLWRSATFVLAPLLAFRHRS